MSVRPVRKQLVIATAALLVLAASLSVGGTVAQAATPSIVIGVNDGSGWGTKDSTAFRERGFTSERIDDGGEGTQLTESIANGWASDTVIVGNVNDEEPLSKVNISKWTEATLAQVKAEASSGATLLEVGNEMYLKGYCGESCYQQKEPVKYAEMFVSLSKAVETAGIKGVKLLFNSFGDYEESKGGPWSQVCCGGGWLAAAEKAEPELRQRVAGFTMHPYGEAGENKENDYGPGALVIEHEQAVALGFENTEYYLTEYGVQVEGEVNSTSLGKQAEKINTVYNELVSLGFVRGIWYYQTHDDSTGKWGLIEPQVSGESPFLPRPSLEKVSSFALAYEGPTTETASAVTATGATLNGTVNPEGGETHYHFEYGTTLSYGTKVPTTEVNLGSGTSAVQVSQAITGLTSGTTYHFRLVAVRGTVSVYGVDRTFVAKVTSAPANTALPTVTGTAQQGQVLTTSTGTWTNEPAAYGYQWERCNATGGECANIANAGFTTYRPGEADVGHTLVVKVTATNGGGSTSASSAATGKVKALLVGDASTAYSVGDQTSAGREEAFQFTAKATDKVEELQFRTDSTANTGITGVVLGIFAENSGKPGEVLGQATVSGEPATNSWVKATGLSVTVASGTKYWLVELPLGSASKQLHFDAAVGSGGAGNVESMATGLSTLTVESSWETYNQGPAGFEALGTNSPAPVNIASPSVTGTAQQGQVLTASHGSWTNEPTSYAYQWERCNSSGGECVNISGATSTTYTLAEADIGHTVIVKVTATNGGGSASASSAATSQVKGLLVGDGSTSYTVSDQTTVGREEAFQFTAKATGKVEELQFRTDATANTGITSVVLGVFAESSGKPGEVLGQATASGEPATSSWIKVTGLSISVVSATKYWLVELPLGTASKQLHFDAAVSSGGTGNLESMASGLSTLTAESSWETYNQGPAGFQAIGP